TQLATVASQVAAKRDLVAGEKARGEVVASPDGQSVMVVAAKDIQPFWKSLLDSLDKREPLVVHSYSPRYFDLAQVQHLVEETARASDDRLHVVVDDLTGSLIVTATAGQHEQIGAFIDRLNAVPPEGRRPMRIFKVRNRGVQGLVGVLQSLLASGEL